MPRISFFYGITIGDVLVGGLPTRALKLVSEWAALHREELK
jgi:hypothetical protein